MSESFFDYYQHHSKRDKLMRPKLKGNGGNVHPLTEVGIPDKILVPDLARIVRQKPFRIIADLMELHVFSNLLEGLPFETAAKILRKYGFIPRKLG